jgi:hypothetical protein
MSYIVALGAGELGFRDDFLACFRVNPLAFLLLN